MLAHKTTICQPFDANTVTEVDRALRGVVTNGDNNSYTFMTTDEWCLAL